MTELKLDIYRTTYGVSQTPCIMFDYNDGGETPIIEIEYGNIPVGVLEMIKNASDRGYTINYVL